MKKIVNELIQNVLQQCNVVGDGQNANGTQVTRALDDLNDAISDLNDDEYLLFNVHQNDVHGKVIKIGPSTNYDIYAREAPMTVKSVSRKIGDRYVPLTIANKTTLDTMNSQSVVPTAYSIETEYDSVEDCMVTIVRLNGNNTYGIRITYLDEMPEYGVNDVINLPRTYMSLIEHALAVKTCQRYKLEFIQMYIDELNDKKEKIERINNSNRPLILDDAIGGAFTDTYYDGITGGRSWTI